MRALVVILAAVVLCFAGGCGSDQGDRPADLNTRISAITLQLDSEDPVLRRNAISKVELYGARAKAAVPALLKIFNQSDDVTNRRRAAGALVSIGPQEGVVAAFVAALQDNEAEVRQTAAKSLRTIGPEAGEEVVPALIDALKNDDEAIVRIAAANALGKFRKDAGAVVPAVTAAFTDDDVEVRCAAAYALGDMGKDAKPAVSVLIQALKEDDMRISGARLCQRSAALVQISRRPCQL